MVLQSRVKRQASMRQASMRQACQNVCGSMVLRSFCPSAHPAHLHTCRKPVRSRAGPGLEARPSEPHTSISSSYHYIYYIHYIQNFLIKSMQSVQSMQKHRRAPQNHGLTAQVRPPALHTLHTCTPCRTRGQEAWSAWSPWPGQMEIKTG